MKQLLPRLLLALAVPALAVAGYFGWQQYTQRQAWAAARPALPAAVGDAMPGLDARLAALAARLERFPPDPAALREFTLVCHANGLLDNAITGYHALLSLEPAEPRWPHLLARILAGYGRLDEALPLLRRTTELAPDATVAWLNLGDALLKSNALADAETAYQQVLAREPANAYALLGLGRCALQGERLTAARSQLQRAVAADPDFASALSLLGNVYEQLGNTEAAATTRARVRRGGHYIEPPDAWSTALLDDCHDPYALLVAASAALAEGRARDALPLLQRGIRLAPSDARLHRQQGKTLASLNDLEGARAAMEHAVLLEPANEPFRLDLLTVIRQFDRETLLAEAVADGLRAIPSSAALHYEAGLLAARAGRLDEAAEHLSFAWKHRPDQLAAAVELATVHFRAGDAEAGVALLETLLKRQPAETTPLLMLVRHGIATGDPRTAGWLDRAIRANAPASVVTELRQDFQRRFGAAP